MISRNCYGFHRLIFLICAGMTPVSFGQNSPIVILPEALVQSKRESLPSTDAVRMSNQLMESGSNSLSSLSADELRQDLIPTFGELFSRVPNAVAMDGGGRSFANIFSIRGIGNSLQYSASSVGIYLDGVPLFRPRQYPGELIDAQAVTIYRGPQPTQFGMAGDAGIVSIETRFPGEHWAGEAAGSYSSFDEQRYKGFSGGPITGNFSVQIGGYFEKSDGYIYNPVTGSNHDETKGFGGEAKFLWRPSSESELAFLIWRQDSKDGANRLSPLGSNPCEFPADYQGKTRSAITVGALRLRQENDDWKLSAVVSGQWWKLDPYRFDADFTADAIAKIKIPIDEESWVGEVTASSKTDLWSEVSWRVGLFAALDTWKFSNERVLAAVGMDSSRQRVSTGQVSTSGWLSIPFLERFRGWIGGRLTWQRDEAMQSYQGPLAPNETLRASKESLVAAPDIGVEFQYDPSTSLYLKCTGGGKPAGYTPFLAATELSEYESEFLINGEIGFKRAWLDNRFAVQAAAFFYSIENYQYESISASGNYSIYNIPEVRGMGFEVECIAQPLDTLLVTSGFGLSDVTIRSGADPMTGRSVRGNQVPYAPFCNFTGSVSWRPLENWLLFLEGLVIGQTPASLDNRNRFTQSTYGLLNLRFGYEWEFASIHFVANNLTDTEYYSLIVPNLGAAGVGSPGQPRSFGVQCSLRY